MSADTDIIMPDEDEPTSDKIEETKRLRIIREQNDAARVYGAPYMIVAWFANKRMKPETFPMMNLNPAIDAARAIHRDGTYYRVAVVNNYSRFEHVVFTRWLQDGNQVNQEEIRQE